MDFIFYSVQSRSRFQEKVLSPRQNTIVGWINQVAFDVAAAVVRIFQRARRTIRLTHGCPQIQKKKAVPSTTTALNWYHKIWTQFIIPTQINHHHTHNKSSSSSKIPQKYTTVTAREICAIQYSSRATKMIASSVPCMHAKDFIYFRATVSSCRKFSKERDLAFVRCIVLCLCHKKAKHKKNDACVIHRLQVYIHGPLSCRNYCRPYVWSDIDSLDGTVDRDDSFPRRAPAPHVLARAYFSCAHLGVRAQVVSAGAPSRFPRALDVQHLIYF
jgi:hypothetical protein